MHYIHHAQGSDKLMVSLIVGDQFMDFWERMAKPQWLDYCRKYSYSLLIFTEPLDISARAEARSLSWQKLLVLSHKEVKKYNQVLWIDADILIASNAPDISKGIKKEMLAATDAWKVFSRELHDHIYALYLEECFRSGKKIIPNPTPERYYTNADLPAGKSNVWQAGVLLMHPPLHSGIFEYVYCYYEEKRNGDYTYNYEMRPLSYHLDDFRPIELDTRFNLIFSNMFLFQNPELFYFWCRGGTLTKEQRIRQLKSALFHSWFLHLAGGTVFLDLCNGLKCSDLEWNV